MFADLNRPFVAAQLDAPQHALAARAADQVLDGAGVRFRALPHVFRIDAATLTDLEAATRLLVRAQDKLLAHLSATVPAAELTAMFEVPAAMARHLDWSRVATSGLRMLRADIIPTATGYWFCELNHFSGVGAGEGFHSAHAFAELLGAPVAGTSPFRQLALQYVQECRRAGLTRVVVLDTIRHRRQGFGEHLMMQRYVRLMAPDLELAYHDENSYPAAWRDPVQARRTLVHRIVTLDDTDDAGAFLTGLHAAGATVTSMFEAELKMHRRWFSLLCDERNHHLFDAEELRVIDRYVPHTFDVHLENLDDVLSDRDGLVFKRSYTYGGRGVLIGDEHPAEELRTLLSADGSAWVAQRRVHTSTLELSGPDGRPVPHSLVLGMFLYGDGASGLLVRGAAGAPSVVNVSQGGGVSWAFAQ